MDEKDRTVMDQGTQIVLIHRELQAIKDHLENLDKVLAMIPSMDKTLNTQQNILESQERRLLILEKENADMRSFWMNAQNDANSRIQGLRDQLRDDRYSDQQAIVEKLNDLVGKFDVRFKEKEDRIRQLENWRWYIIGIMAAAGLIVPEGVPWKIIFAQ